MLEISLVFQAADMLCQISDGTVLGAVKFNSALPWEIDADMEIDSTNHSTYLKMMVPKLKNYGYKVVSLFCHQCFL